MPAPETIVFGTLLGVELPAKLDRPPDADTLFVLGHGSWSTVDVPFMAAMRDALGNLRIASLRFKDPYSADPGFVPFTDIPVDDDEALIATMRWAIEYGKKRCPSLKLAFGGHSISGLVATYADAEDRLPTAGIVALGFPREGDPRAATSGKRVS